MHLYSGGSRDDCRPSRSPKMKEFSIRFARLSFSLLRSLKSRPRKKRRIHLCVGFLELDVLLFKRVLSDDEKDDGALAAMKINCFFFN